MKVVAVKKSRWARVLTVRSIGAALALALYGATGAQAALFEDTDARRAILELRQQRASDMEGLRLQVEQLKRNLLDINSQLESVRRELAQQRGREEELTREVTELQRHQQDLKQGVNERVSRLEPQTIDLDGKSFQAAPDEKAQFDAGLEALRKGDFAGAVTRLSSLLTGYPATGYKESALYWLGNAQYAQRNYKSAMGYFRELLNASPQHLRAPEAMLSLASCHAELKETKAASKVLTDLVAAYPNSEAAQAARERLAAANTTARRK